MTRDELKQYFQEGDIVFFRDTDDNPGYHYSYAARALNYFQSWFESGDSTVIHVGLIHSFSNETPRPGHTDMLIIDSMPPNGDDPGGVAIRPLVRNYSIEIFRLKNGISHVDSTLLAKTALEIAEKFKSIGYSLAHCKETLTHRSLRENADINEFYTLDLRDRHLFNAQTKEIIPNTLTDGMNCSEFIITCYQLAYLTLSQAGAVKEILPEFIRLHAHSSPARFHEFLIQSGYYERIGIEPTHALRFSGTPRIEDSLALVPYSPPTPTPVNTSTQSWSAWIWSYAWNVVNLLPTLWQSSSTPVPVAIEMKSHVEHMVQLSKGGASASTNPDLETHQSNFTPLS